MKWLENRKKMFLHTWKGLFTADEAESKHQAVALKLPVAS